MIVDDTCRFGGNPEEVTIAGESAGGASVVMQTVAFGGTVHKVYLNVYISSPATLQDQSRSLSSVPLPNRSGLGQRRLRSKWKLYSVRLFPTTGIIPLTLF